MLNLKTITLFTSGNEDFKVYRYSEEKTLAWLKSKVERTSEYLSTSEVSVSSGQSSSYVRSSKPIEAPKGKSLDPVMSFSFGYELVSVSFSQLHISDATVRSVSHLAVYKRQNILRVFFLQSSTVKMLQ